MADKPSRGLVLYGDGLMRTVTKAHTNLHSLASRASCGFLSLSQHHHSENEEDDRLVREFAELVDTCESYLHQRGEDAADSVLSTPTIGERFMGMRAAIITNNSCLQAFGNNFGLTSLPYPDLIKNNLSHVNSPPVDTIASEVLNLLGFQDGKTLNTSQFDLVFMHIGAGEDLHQVDAAIEYLDDLVGEILRIAPCGSEIASRLHFSVVMSYGNVTKDDDPALSFLKNEVEPGSDLSRLYPRQSYTVKGGNQRCGIRYYCPMLSAQVQDAVTRIDKANMFTFEDFKEHCGNLTIPADRFLHEIAFKLWKAPKYGA